LGFDSRHLQDVSLIWIAANFLEQTHPLVEAMKELVSLHVSGSAPKDKIHACFIPLFVGSHGCGHARGFGSHALCGQAVV
jgi:hypothetical protein